MINEINSSTVSNSNNSNSNSNTNISQNEETDEMNQVD